MNYLVSKAGAVKWVRQVAGVGQLRKVGGDVLGSLQGGIGGGLGHIVQLAILLAHSIEACTPWTINQSNEVRLTRKEMLRSNWQCIPLPDLYKGGNQPSTRGHPGRASNSMQLDGAQIEIFIQGRQLAATHGA